LYSDSLVKVLEEIMEEIIGRRIDSIKTTVTELSALTEVRQ